MLIKKTPTLSPIEEGILHLQQKSQSSSEISLGEVVKILSGKGRSLILLVLTLPFCQPIQIPGLSIPFGLAIAFIGLRIALGKNTWLPKTILAKTISTQTLQKITEKILWIVRKVKPWIHPRLIWLSSSPPFQMINGLLISVMGLALALPLPIPFSNLMAAWSIFFIGFGLLEDDGICILIGYFACLLTLLFFFAIAFSITHII